MNVNIQEFDFSYLLCAELAKDPAFAFICYLDADYVTKAGIQGIKPDTVMGHHGVGIFWNVTEWTISE